MSLEILQNSQENACARYLFLNKVAKFFIYLFIGKISLDLIDKNWYNL